MFTCIICRFAQELDDVAVRRAGSSRCICLRCFARETESAMPMPKALREQVTAALAEGTVAA